MRAADIPVGRGTHNNASVSGRELADLFLHVGFGSRDDGSYGRKKNGLSLLSLFWPAKKKKTLRNGGQRPTASGCSEQTPHQDGYSFTAVVGKLLARGL